MGRDLNVVLVHPEIPQNTGNVSRTCAVTGASLHIVRPTGFEISDRTLKRAGLDYWDKLDVHYYDSFEELCESKGDAPTFFFSSHAEKMMQEVTFPGGAYLVFGRESSGLEPEILEPNLECAVRIPMRGEVRCLNLSNAVAVAVYEALRQNGYEEMS